MVVCKDYTLIDQHRKEVVSDFITGRSADDHWRHFKHYLKQTKKGKLAEQGKPQTDKWLHDDARAFVENLKRDPTVIEQMRRELTNQLPPRLENLAKTVEDAIVF